MEAMSSSKTPEGVSHNGLLYCDATAVAARLVKPLRTIEKERGEIIGTKIITRMERGACVPTPRVELIHWGFLRADDILGADRGCSRDE